MQTFLPDKDFSKSALILDRKRILKQVIEAKQILDTILLGRKAWSNHPAVNMWRGHEIALTEYYNIFWEVCKEKWNVKWVKMRKLDNLSTIIYPKWLGDERLHSSHRANLLRKDKYYLGFGWSEKPYCGLKPTPYFWPTQSL